MYHTAILGYYLLDLCIEVFDGCRVIARDQRGSEGCGHEAPQVDSSRRTTGQGAKGILLTRRGICTAETSSESKGRSLYNSGQLMSCRHMSATTWVNPEHQFAVHQRVHIACNCCQAEGARGAVKVKQKLYLPVRCVRNARHDATGIACTTDSQPPMW
jgi:hypothetical protein